MRKLLVIITLGLVCVSLICGSVAYIIIGKTPGELLDYADVRLQGHPKLEWIAAPIFSVVRQITAQPKLEERLAKTFHVPILSPFSIDKSLVEALPKPSADVLRVGPGQQYLSIAEAARTAKDGQVVEILAGNYFGEVAVWSQRKLTIRGIGGRARLYANGQSAEGKAIWVFRNGDFVVENIEFFDAKVSDNNGAGIRAEAGSLIVQNCLFYGNQNGILTSDKLALLEVLGSEFAYSGAGDGQSHGIYVGPIAEFRAFGNYFHHSNRGHLIKSRAEKNTIAYNRLTDETNGRASYEIDLPNAGRAFVGFNLIQQSATGENSTLISFGVEGLRWQQNELWLEKNTLVNDNPWGGTFLRVAKGVSNVTAVNNLMVGQGGYQSGATSNIIDNIDAEWRWFILPQRLNYHLKNIISPVATNYARPEWSPKPGYYIDATQYKLDPAAIHFAGALPVQRVEQ